MKDNVKRSLSKAPLANFIWGTKTQSVYPDFDPNAVLQMINEDPVARGAFLHKVDKCMEGDYAILDKDTASYDDTFEQTLDSKYKFRSEVLRKTFLYLSLFNNAYIEVVRNEGDNTTKALNVLDTPNVAPITAPNGDPIAYKLITSPTDADPEWSAKDITWIKLNDRNRGIAPVDLQALWRVLHLKKFILRYVGWLWESGQYRVIHNLKDSSGKSVEDFLAYNRKVDTQFDKPFLAYGEYAVSQLRDMKETEYVVQLLKYIDNQICVLIRVPPIDAGIPETSGRSNADAQSNNLSTHITSTRKLVEDALNFDLFPKINKSNSRIRFAPVDRFAEKQVFEVAQIMKSMMMKPAIIAEYLSDKGMVFKTQDLFEEIVMPGNTPNPRNKDNAPSRVGKGTGEANKVQDAPTTRPDQL